MFVTAKLLRFRRGSPDLFLAGGYEPLKLRGADADRFVAFRRSFGGRQAVAVAPRVAGAARWQPGHAGLRPQAGDAALDPRDAGGVLRDVFTGAVLSADGRLDAALASFPFGLFVSR